MVFNAKKDGQKSKDQLVTWLDFQHLDNYIVGNYVLDSGLTLQ